MGVEDVREAEPQAGDEHEPAAAERPRTVPTMRDIAVAAGVSQSTVSRVLNDVPTRVPIAPVLQAE